ncbi:MAG: hypothetical protein Kow0077_12440 [Anaerolineae bacterium]
MEWRNRWDSRLRVWGAWLRELGLDGLVGALLEAAEPLSPLGAQLLFVAQPALDVFWPAESIGRWAERLEDPETIAWMRTRLMMPDENAVNKEGPPDGSVN